jgi:hypothetical protein
MEQVDSSERFPQELHVLVSFLSAIKACVNCSISTSLRFNNCKTSRSAVRLPIPGKDES